MKNTIVLNLKLVQHEMTTGHEETCAPLFVSRETKERIMIYDSRF